MIDFRQGPAWDAAIATAQQLVFGMVVRAFWPGRGYALAAPIPGFV